ncbi:hypothetical protein GDO81_025914 [Engystomops pustulosus]|uniref:HAUS augmin-like complex subunit 3 N-terminal domain-containing protein n=1 Tax=Engystomops pustulosus TaxID=76066 RepID=A0AAV6ZG75_ENGPU|nr:hypothetical protein GDO81_025914 [Engystomops pustulosus]KAG8548267.1 hypothetical protein GDO81_025914 [Engystomops pustulosus]
MAKHLAPPSTKSLSRQRSMCFLLEPQRVQGSDFVNLLCRIGYPGAQDLKGEDFDWLCEGNEEIQHFLGWLCEVIDQRNVLSSEQLEAYNVLLESGQPLLEAEEIQNLLKGKDKGDDDEWEMEDMKSLEELEAELQGLRSLKAHRLQSRNKMESLGLTLLHNRLSWEKIEKKLEKNLNQVKEELCTLNSRCNSTLVSLRENVKELGRCHSTQMASSLFVSSLDLEGYLRMEDTCWEQVEEHAKRVLPVTEEDLEKLRKTQMEMGKESERLRTAWASQRMQLSIALGTLNGNMEALAWLDGGSGEQVWDPLRLPMLEREVQFLELEVEALQRQRLLGLVCEASLGLCLPALHGWVQSEKHRLSQVEQNQALVAEVLLSQFSRLQQVELGIHTEMRQHCQTERGLRELRVEMENRIYQLGKRLLGQRDVRTFPQWLVPLHMDSKDQTAVSLSAMLEHPSKQKEFFPKYEVLQRQAASLLQELRALSGLYHEPLEQTARLERDCELLHQSLCRGSRNLQLQDPNLTLTLETLFSNVSQFNYWFLDFLRELEHKKNLLQTSCWAQGRKLYVLFYKDPALLASMVEDLEQRVKDLQ